MEKEEKTPQGDGGLAALIRRGGRETGWKAVAPLGMRHSKGEWGVVSSWWGQGFLWPATL